MGQWNTELVSLLSSSCRIFASAGAGYNWADVDALASRKIWYANGAAASDEADSDTGLYMILSVFRSFTHTQLAARACEVEGFEKCHKLCATISPNPRGHVLGIEGLGNISKKLVYKAKMALGMEFHYFNVVRAGEDVERELGATFHAGLDDLLKTADCVSLHTLLNKHTQDLVSAPQLALMQKGARIINTARGQVLNEYALVEALESGHISAAGLDVHYNESKVARRLADMPNVTLTTHMAGDVLNARINFEVGAMKNNGRQWRVHEPLTPVNKNARLEEGSK